MFIHLVPGIPPGVVGLSAPPARIAIHLDQPGAAIPHSLYGVFFEEINQAGDNGLYGELLRNRGLESISGTGAPAETPKEIPGWRLDSGVTIVAGGPNEAHSHSFSIPRGLSVTNIGVAGISVVKDEKYHVTLWAKGSGNVGVGFGQSPIKIGRAGERWKRFEKTLKSGGTVPNVGFAITAMDGPIQVAYASLMPEKLWKDRKNGLRTDLAEKVDALKPGFVRFPGGCFVEGGDRFADAFDWKASLGPVDARKGLARSTWGYPVTYGLGYHEYLQWCEDLGAAPLFVANVGLNHAQIAPLEGMDAWVQSALNAIEYANGPIDSKWGAERAKAGHPAPFGLKHVEIGNENGAWAHGGDAAYAPRYRMMVEAIKAKYPEIVTIADNAVPYAADMVDEHYYSDPKFFWANATKYDGYSRSGPKIYVGEYAVTQGAGKGNLDAALGEAAFMTGMERNADVVRMASYAPLLTNVGNQQWGPDAIVFDASRSFGTPSYYVQLLFANNRPDRNVAVSVPSLLAGAPAPGGGVGLMTWSTKAEFTDLTISAGGQTLYTSHGVRASGFANPRGDWSVGRGVLTQSSLDADRSIDVKGAVLPAGDYTVDVKARKLEGKEGFFVVVDKKDGDQLRWNVGGWGNTMAGFERNGTVVGERVPFAVEAGRWYEVRIERLGDVVRGYIDGKLVQELRENGIPSLVAVAGVDEKARELVVKVVNGSNDARPIALDLSGGAVGGAAKAIVLTGPDLAAENSFDAPKAVAPTTTNVAWDGTLTLEPRSVTVLRLPIR